MTQGVVSVQDQGQLPTCSLPPQWGRSVSCHVRGSLPPLGFPVLSLPQVSPPLCPRPCHSSRLKCLPPSHHGIFLTREEAWGTRQSPSRLPLRFNTCGRFPTVASALFIFRRDSPEAVDFPLRPAPPCATPPPAQTAVPRPARGPLGRTSLQHRLCSAHPRPPRFLRAGESPSSSARGDLACRAVWGSILEGFWYFLFIILIIYPTCAKQPRL